MSSFGLCHLGDDVLSRIVAHLSTADWQTRFALMRSCRRLLAIGRLAETLWISLRCDGWPTELPGVGVAVADAGERVCPVAIGVNSRSLHTVGARLAAAMALLSLAYRHTAARVGVRSLQLQRHASLSTILPQLLQHIGGVGAVAAAARLPPLQLRAQSLCEVSLCQCSLTVSIGLMLPSLRRLRLWECPLVEDSSAGRRALVAGLARLPLQAFLWAGQRHPAPAELLCVARDTGLSSFCCSFDSAFEALDEAHLDVGWCSLGAGLEEFILLDRSFAAQAHFFSALARALSTWTALRVLRLGAEDLSRLSYAMPLPQLLVTLPALTSLGQVECSWQDPVWFFEALDGQQLLHLTDLSIYINSPGAPPSWDESDEWGEGCALRQVAAALVSALPRLHTLFIEWYEEDVLAPQQVAAALRPLCDAPALKCVRLLRSSVNCARFGGEPAPRAARAQQGASASDGIGSSTLEPQPRSHAELQSQLPSFRVTVHNDSRQSSGSCPFQWLLEDSVGVSSACSGLASSNPEL